MQKDKGIVRAVAVLPFNVHAVAGREVDLNGLGINGGHEFSIAWPEKMALR